MELWGLKEGTYMFQLTRTDSDQPEDTANLTITVLTAKQTEGDWEWAWGVCSAPQPTDDPLALIRKLFSV